MNRNIQEPLKLPVHPELLTEINDMRIAIQAWHGNLEENDSQTKLLRERYKKPTWADITDLLRRSYNAINEQREDPRKY